MIGFYDGEDLARAVNWYRKKHGLAPLGAVPELAKIAQQHAERMARLRRIFHSGHSGGEVVAAGFRSPSHCAEGWRLSRQHWRIIKAASRGGFGYAEGKNSLMYFVGCF